MKITKKFLSIILFFVILMSLFTGCNTGTDKVYQNLEDFEKAKIGVLTGSSQALIAKERFPDAKLVYFSTPADMVLAVEQGKIDCYMYSTPFLPATIWENAKVKRIGEAISQGEIAFAFPKNGSSDALRRQLNEFLQQAKKDGTLERLEAKWLGNTEPTEHPDYKSLTGENGTIRLAAAADNKPLIYRYKNQCTGYEMELLTLFARQYGYRFEIEIVPFESVIMGMATGKYDMASASLQITPERSQSVNFSEPYMTFDVILVVKDDGKRQPSEMTISDLDNATLGLITGTNWAIIAEERFPNAEKMYFTSNADAIMALQQGKIDSFLADRTVYAGIRWENENLTFIDEPIEEIKNALVLAKNGYDENLLSQLNEFIAKAKEDGTIEALTDKWFGNEEPAEHPDYQSLTGKNGTINVAVGDYMKPTTYQKGTTCTGYEVDFLTLFAKEYGYKLEIKGMSFDALLPSVTSGKYDIAACGITITPERKESITFTDPNFETYGVAVIRGDYVADEAQGIKTLDDVKKGTLAVMTGTVWDGVAKKEISGAKIKYYSSTTDVILALEQGKVDGMLGPETFYATARWEKVPVTVIYETEEKISSAFMMAKEKYDEVLLGQLNEFIALSKENGTLEALSQKWISEAEPTEHPDYRSLTGENGTLKIAVDNTAKPMVYRKNDLFTGHDVEFLTEFARAYGYRLEFIGMSFDGLIPAVASGKCNLGACGIAITPERAENVTFTDSYLELGGTLVVNQNVGNVEKENFFDRIYKSFEKTFIREERWKLIVEGMAVTMIISICAALSGTILGLALYMLSRSDIKLIKKSTKWIAKVYSRIIAGTPVIVILMILYYVIFGKVRDISGVVVAIIGFALVFGSFVYEHMTLSVGSIDRGQTEAAYALGYTKSKTFFRILLPQAMKIFLPSYCGNAVELIKATAVVGYIAVNDLTKMGDIIRSNTYEAFFPLIATALIYFLLTWIISLLLGLVRIHFEPHRRSKEKILKRIKKG